MESRRSVAQVGRVRLTDGDGLNADTLLEMSIGGIIRIFALQYLLATQSIDKSCTS